MLVEAERLTMQRGWGRSIAPFFVKEQRGVGGSEEIVRFSVEDIKFDLVGWEVLFYFAGAWH